MSSGKVLRRARFVSRIARFGSLLGLAVLLTGCGQDNDSGSDAPVGQQPDAGSSRMSDTVPVEMIALAVEGEGLRVIDATTGSTTPLPFGSPGPGVRETLVRITGRQPDEEGEGIECGPATYSTWEDGISIWTTDRGFAGWSILDADSPLTTIGGVGIGSTLAEMEEVMSVEVFESTIGIEFSSGGLAGLLSDNSPTGRVTHLWAGEICIAR